MSATCLIASRRGIFVREAWTPVSLQSPDSAEAPFPARLLWQFRSSTPRHLTLCVRGPASRLSAVTAGSSCEDLEADGEATTIATEKASVTPRKAEDFVYGRLFLRPYDVAQLLTVLQGWSDAPATVKRPRSFLQLSAVPAPSAAASTKAPPSSKNTKVMPSPFSSAKPRAVQLTARFTRKVLSPAQRGDRAVTTTSATPTTDLDPEASEDYPGSVYVEGELGTLTTVLRDEDLVLLTAHLESVLSDFFSIEHNTIREAARRAVERQGRPGRARYTSAQERSGDYAVASHPRTSTYDSRPQYRSYLRRSPQNMEGAAAAPQHATASHPHTAAATAATATQADNVMAGGEEYEEVVEEVEEEEAEENSTQPLQQERHGNAAGAAEVGCAKQSGSVTAATAKASPAAKAEAEVDNGLLGTEADVSSRAEAASSTRYTTTHTADRGTMTMESDNRYATGRFVRDGGVAASEVQEVSRIGDFDVLHRTQQAQGSVEHDGARTTVRASNTTGAFRSTTGEVTGTFAYQKMSSTTETTSATTAAAAASATAIPVRRVPTSSAGQTPTTTGAGEGGMDEGPTLEVKATTVKGAEGESEAEEAEEEGEAPPAEKSKQKRASGSRHGGKKKGGKKKSKKALRHKAAPKATAAGSPTSTMSF